MNTPLKTAAITDNFTDAFPLFTAKQFEAQGFTLPDIKKTAQALLPLTQAFTTRDAPIAKALQEYRHFYGLDRLNAQHIQGYITVNHQSVHIQIWLPLQPAKGTVWLVTGYLEHSGTYQPLYAQILQQGYTIIIFDLPGHGLSQGKRAHIDDFAHYQDILKYLMTWAHAHAGAALPKPWYSIAQSTGAGIVMQYLLEHAKAQHIPEFDKALLLSPLVKPTGAKWFQNPPMLLWMRYIQTSVKRKFKRNNHHERFIDFLHYQDPLRIARISSGWVIAQTRWQRYMLTLPPCSFKIWTAQGEKDNTVDWQFNLPYIESHFHVTNKLMLPECLHQLVNERSDMRQPLTQMIDQFLNS